MSLLEFYTSLPKPNKSLIYIPGYTEALSTFTGVRVIPNESFTDHLDQNSKNSLRVVGYPCYFIPIIQNNNCYGYVFKGLGKPTPRYGNTYRLPGFDSVKPNSTVVFVEGFKDAFVLRKLGYTCLPMLTTQPSRSLLSQLVSLKCHVVLIPDNDTHRDNTLARFSEKASRLGLSWEPFYLQYCSDLGDFFQPNLKQQVLQDVSRFTTLYSR